MPTDVNACVGSALTEEDWGEVMLFPHFGHGPEIPAMRMGTVRDIPHQVQLKLMTSSSVAVMLS